jgi:outer membrane protein
MKKFYIQFGIFLVILLTTHIGFAYDIATLYKHAQQSSNLVKANAMQVLAQHAQTHEADAAFLPHIGLEASYGRLDSHSSLNEPFTMLPSLSSDFSSSEHFSSILFGIKQSVVNYSARHKIKASKFMEQAKKLEVQISTQASIFNFLELYFTTLEYKEKLAVIALQKKDIIHDKKLALHKLAKGTGTVLPVYETEMYLKGLTAEHIVAENNLNNAFIKLSMQTGLPVKQLDDINTKKVLTLLPPHTLAYWLQQVNQGNLSLQKAQFELQALREMVSSDRAEGYPTVDLEAGISHAHENVPVFQTMNANNKMIELSIKVPLFSGNYISSKTQKTVYQVSADEYRYQDAVIQLQQSTRTIYADILALHSKLLADVEAIKVANATLKATQKLMRLQMKTYDSLLETEHAVAKAQLTFQEDAYNALLLRAKLYQLAGQLNQQHINELNALLITPKVRHPKSHS